MTKTLLILSSIIFLLFSSCGKRIEDRLLGEWRLESTYKKGVFSRDYFQTGYESGVFTFFESGTATYVSSQASLSGYWKADNWVRYDASSDKSEVLKYLEIFLADFSSNKIINWRFDNFNFRNGWKCIRAVDFSLGRDRIYEFVRP